MPISEALDDQGFVERFLGYHTLPLNNIDCCLWEGHLGGDGQYGIISLRGSHFKAHRVSYEYYRGPIPEGLVIDHLCRQHQCIHPWHLDAVPQTINHRRGLRAPKNLGDLCSRGHLLTEENTRKRSNRSEGLICKSCMKLRDALRRQRKKRVVLELSFYPSSLYIIKKQKS